MSMSLAWPALLRFVASVGILFSISYSDGNGGLLEQVPWGLSLLGFVWF